MKSLHQIYTEVSVLPNRSTDKGLGTYQSPPDGIGHTYTGIYDLLFSKFRDKPINFLEIGINYGGSLKMWREYFTSARISGIDIRNSFLPFSNDEKIHTFVFDAGDKSAVDNIFGPETKFDIIIDDGAHEWQSQLKLFQLWSSRVSIGGLYVIEDVQDINDSFDKFLSATPYRPTIIDRRHINRRYDDVLLVYQF